MNNTMKDKLINEWNQFKRHLNLAMLKEAWSTKKSFEKVSNGLRHFSKNDNTDGQ